MTDQHRPPDLPILSGVPVFAAYVGTPIVQTISGYFHHQPSPTGQTVLWLGLAIFAFMSCALRGLRGRFALGRSLLRTSPLLIAAVLIGRHGMPLLTPGLALRVLELRPLAYLLFAALWASTFGLPRRTHFQWFGALLGFFAVVNFAVGGPLSGLAHADLRTLQIPGDMEFTATLLLISLAACLLPASRDGGGRFPASGNTSWKLWIALGLVATFSRSGLFTATWLTLLFAPFSWKKRLAAAAFFALALTATFHIARPPMAVLEEMRRGLLGLAALHIFTTRPEALLTGFPLGAPLPAPPVVLQALGSRVQAYGLLPQFIAPFWLRHVLSWGVGPLMAFLGTVGALSFRRRTRFAGGVVATMLIQGLVCPLLNDGLLAVPIFLALILSLRESRTEPNFTFEPAAGG